MNDKFATEMNGKLYQVQILAKTFVDTTVAVMAESEEEATRMALDGVNGQPDRWVHCSPVHDLEVLNVSQEAACSRTTRNSALTQRDTKQLNDDTIKKGSHNGK